MEGRSTKLHEQSSNGSLGAGEPLFLAVGQLRRPHGVRGEMQMALYTDFPERLKPGITVYIGENHQFVTIRSRRMHREVMLIAFDEYPDRTAVEVLRNQIVYVSVESIPELPDGDFYQFELIDLNVFTDEGHQLGVVEEILETGANDVLLVRQPDGKEVLLPFIDEVILKIDLDSGILLVHLLPGLVQP